MSEIVTKSLGKIAKSSSLVIAGTFTSLLLGFLARVIFVRFTTQEEFGLYSLALTVVVIAVNLSTLGMGNGATRCIAYLHGKNEQSSVKNTICSALLATLITSIFITLLIVITSNIVSIKIFNTAELSSILIIMSITIPFMTLMNVLIAIFRGYNRIDAKLYFNDFLKPFIYIILLLIVVSNDYSFIEFLYSYIGSIILSFIALFIYYLRSFSFKPCTKILIYIHSLKKLVFFSVSLLVVNVLLTMMSWTDTLMLGFFKTPLEVATYNAVYPVAMILSLIINSIGFLYIPIVSSSYSKNQMKEIAHIYMSSTKWCFLLTLPIFYVLFLFPDVVLNLFYGSRYVGGSITLQVLAMGYILNSYFGCNYYTLIATGNSPFLMKCSLIGAALNIILNAILIPQIGILGAGIASAISFATIEFLMTFNFNKLYKINPFSHSYLKISVISFFLLLTYKVIVDLFESNFYVLVLSLISFLFLYSILLVKTQSFDENDFEFITKLEKKIGFKASKYF